MSPKISEISKEIANIPSGASVMIGGFGVPGTPFLLVEALANSGARDLTIIKNDANENDMGVDWLFEAGAVRKLITSHIGLNRNAQIMLNAGSIAVEFVPQGILAERVRAGGAGLKGILTDIGIGTDFAKGKPIYELNGERVIVETALRADFALLHAEQGDEMGNLTYAATARNFNPLMAMAADHVIVEVEKLVPAGAIPAEVVHTPSPFVDAVIEMPEIPEVYDVVRR